MRSGGLGSGWGVARETRERLSLGGEDQARNAPGPRRRWQERSTPITGRVPSDRRDQPRPLNGVQRAKDLNTPTRWTGPGTEGYINSVGSGPCCLRRATSNPQRQHSLVGDPSRERIRSVRSYPGNRDRAPKISMVGNLGKAKQHGHYHSLRSTKRGLAAPPRRFSPNC